MKRAILVTTGTIVGITSVLAYKPSIDALALVPGTESLSTSAGVKSSTPESTSSSSTAAATTDAAPTQAAAADETTATPSATATAKATTKASTKATKTPSASASATATSSPTPSSTPSPSAASTSTSFSEGTHSGAGSIVESRGHTYGTLVATVTVNNGTMTELSFSQTPTGRNEQFINAVNTYLVPEILRTQNVTVGIVTGATGTSMALINSLKSALGLA